MFVGQAWLGPVVYVGLLLLSLGLLFSPSVRESTTGGTAEAKPSMVITDFNGPGIGLGMPLTVFGLGIGGGWGVGLGLGWGFGNAYGCQYRSSRVQFQGIEFQKNV